MKTCRAVELFTFGEWSACPGRLTPRKGPQYPLDVWLDESQSRSQSNLHSPVVNYVASVSANTVQLKHIWIPLPLWLVPRTHVVIGLSPQRTGFNPRPLYVGFVLNRVIVEQVLLRELQVCDVSNIPSTLHNHTLIYHQRYVILVIDSAVKQRP